MLDKWKCSSLLNFKYAYNYTSQTNTFFLKFHLLHILSIFENQIPVLTYGSLKYLNLTMR